MIHVECLNDTDLMGYDMRLFYGKPTTIPENPMYVYKKEDELVCKTCMPFSAKPLDYDDKDGGLELMSKSKRIKKDYRLVFLLVTKFSK